MIRLSRSVIDACSRELPVSHFDSSFNSDYHIHRYKNEKICERMNVEDKRKRKEKKTTTTLSNKHTTYLFNRFTECNFHLQLRNLMICMLQSYA